jgi:hypothetical protein
MTEIEKLAQMLEKEGIPYGRHKNRIIFLENKGNNLFYFDRCIIIFYEKDIEMYCNFDEYEYGKAFTIDEYFNLPYYSEKSYEPYVYAMKGYITIEQIFDALKKYYNNLKNNQ